MQTPSRQLQVKIKQNFGQEKCLYAINVLAHTVRLIEMNHFFSFQRGGFQGKDSTKVLSEAERNCIILLFFPRTMHAADAQNSVITI